MRDEQAFQALADAERASWGELMALLSRLSPRQVLQPGYYAEGWSAKDLLAHVAGWLAEAGLVLEQIRTGTFTGRDLDIEGLNATFLEANRDLPYTLVNAEAHAARQRLLGEVHQLEDLTDAAAVWLEKAGPQHYNEHLPRLKEWVAELQAR
jgi:hypothetical protein